MGNEHSEDPRVLGEGAAAERPEQATPRAPGPVGEQEGEQGEGSGDGTWDDGAGDEEDEHTLDFELPHEIKPAGLVVLARRHLDDDEAYTLEPDVALMRTQRAEADLRTEEALVINVLGRKQG